MILSISLVGCGNQPNAKDESVSETIKEETTENPREEEKKEEVEEVSLEDSVLSFVNEFNANGEKHWDLRKILYRQISPVLIIKQSLGLPHMKML